MSTDATKEGLHFDQIHRSRRHKAFRLRDHFRGQERGGRDPAGHAARQRPLPDRKRTGYFRRSSAAGDPARYGRGDPALRPQHARDRLHPRRNATAPIELVRRIRASYYLIGAELGRFGHAHVAMPGGCNSVSAPSTSISRASRPWAPWSSRPAAMSAPTPRRARAARRPCLSRYCLRRRDDEHPACGSFGAAA